MFKLNTFMKGETTVQAVLIIKLVIKLFFFVSFFSLGLKHPHILSAPKSKVGLSRALSCVLAFKMHKK